MGVHILNDEYGISAHGTTITKDIAALQESGLDAVESSEFITKKKSDVLIEKIYTMTSSGQTSKLRQNNYVLNRIKPDNEQIYFQYYGFTG